MDYPNYATYNKLYARYVYKRPVSELVDHAGDLDGKFVVDLCGGEGRLATHVTSRFRAIVKLVDESPCMLPNSEDLPHGVERFTSTVFSFLADCADNALDVVFCRQAINYWFDNSTIRLLAKKMKSGGKFIFNTFMYKPPEKPQVKEYLYVSDEGTLNYVEISWRVGETIHHVQICEGMEPHSTCFRQIDMDQMVNTLRKNGLEPKIYPDSKTLIYACTKE